MTPSTAFMAIFMAGMETRLISPAVWNGPRKSRPRRKRIAVSRAMRTTRPWIIARIILPGAGTKCRKSGKHQGTQVPGTFHPAPREIARASTPGRRTAPVNRSETRYGDFGHDGSCCLSDIVNPVLHPGSTAMKKPSKSGTFPAMIPITCPKQSSELKDAAQGTDRADRNNRGKLARKGSGQRLSPRPAPYFHRNKT